ncbi:MAG: outer membrane protein transport protein [Flavobacteriales bacterium]|nr:outer membrane protein transport protein [Flavobacteriales bacterium]
MLEFRLLAAIFFIFVIVNVTVGGGFQVNLQGTKQLGMGHCGTSLIMGSESMFFNPGAFAMSDRSSFVLSANFVIPHINYLAPYPSTYTASANKSVSTPFTISAAVKPDSVRWIAGVSVYTPFGSGISYEDNWLGQFVLREMSLQAIFYQPTVGFKINNKIGIGAGYVYGSGEFYLRKGVPLQNTDGEYGEAVLQGSGQGHGFNVGVFYNPFQNLNIGISYRSKVAVNVKEGTAAFDVVPYLADSFPDNTFSTKLTLPSVFNLGASYNVSEKFKMALDLNYVGWKVYDTLSFDFAQNSEILDDINSPRMYKNSYIIRLGGQYELKPNIHLRAGAYFDKSPVLDDYITPETPDSDKLGLTVGGSLRAKRLQVDLALLYITGKKRTAINKETQFGGTWKATAFVPSISLGYLF